MNHTKILETLEKIKQLVEPDGWLSISEERRGGKVDQITVTVSFKPTIEASKKH